MNWADVLPPGVVLKQQHWERRERIYRAMVAGAQNKEIASRLGITTSRVREIRKGLTRRRTTAPILLYFRESKDVYGLARRILMNRVRHVEATERLRWSEQ